MRIEWSVAAERDLEEIFDFIFEDNPDAALRVRHAISDAVERLTSYPESGRPGRRRGTREVVIAGTPYIIPYQATRDVIHVLRVIHAARHRPPSND